MRADAVGSPTGPERLRVDLSGPTKKADRAASGSLYGLGNRSRPSASLLAPLRPKNFTQKAPGGLQWPDGDALEVAPLAAAHGATVTIRLPDAYADFPYTWISLDSWLETVRLIAEEVIRSNPPNIYAYEVWNEPDWTWRPAAPPFIEVWTATVQLLRAIDPARRVLGPSLERWNENWMRRFLVATTQAGTAPDIVSWHELDPADADDLSGHVREYRELERSLELSPRPISINEYGTMRDLGTPGRLARYIAAIERSHVDTANLAFWHRPGRLADLVTADGNPTGAWWLYEWYGRMEGAMLATESSSRDGLDGFACEQVDGSVLVVAGGAQGTGVVDLIGAHEFGSVVTAECWSTPWTGPDGVLLEPLRRFSIDLKPVADRLSVVLPIDRTGTEAFAIVLRPTVAPRATSKWHLKTGIAATRDDAPGWPAFISGKRGLSVVAEVPALSGPALIDLRLSNPGAVPRVVTVRSGEHQVSLTLDERDSGYSTRTVELRGIPNARVEIDAKSPVAVDYLEARPWRVRLQADEAELERSSLVLVDMRTTAFAAHRFAGDSYVTEGIGSLGGGTSWNVRVPASGVYRFVLGYANGGHDSLVNVTVDGTSKAVLSCPPTQGWHSVGSTAIEATLDVGLHRISLSTRRLMMQPSTVNINFLDIVWERGESDA